MKSVFVAVLSLVALGGAANASLVHDTNFFVDLSGQGFGQIQDVLALHATPYEQGAMTWTTSGDVATMDNLNLSLGPNDVVTSGNVHSQTYTITQTGWTSAADVRLIFNGNETGNPGDNGKKISLQDMRLLVFNSAGVLKFDSGPFTEEVLDVAQGQGNAGWIYKLDAAQVIALNATGAFATPGAFHVGAAMIAGCQATDSTCSDTAGPRYTSDDGADNVYLFNAVPEPGFYGALALGMSGLFILVRRKRSTAK